MLYIYLLFLFKTLTIIVAILLIFAGILAIASKGKNRTKEELVIKKLNDHYDDLQNTLLEKVLTKAQFKKSAKNHKKIKKDTVGDATRQRIFVVNFTGDIRASAVKSLREEITAILLVATSTDEVVVRLESSGGMVHAYGLAAVQLQRIRKKQIGLTVVIDKVAASGGYMMAAVANRILAAPFAVIGSIGVIAQLPNFNKLLKRNHIEFEQIMAGQYKRTLTLFGENTPEDRQKLQSEIDETQELFKAFLRENRPFLPIHQVATGEHWYGTQALELGLIDEVTTSDDYLLSSHTKADLYEVCHRTKKTLLSKLSTHAQQSYALLLDAIGNKHTKQLL